MLVGRGIIANVSTCRGGTCRCGTSDLDLTRTVDDCFRETITAIEMEFTSRFEHERIGTYCQAIRCERGSAFMEYQLIFRECIERCGGEIVYEMQLGLRCSRTNPDIS